MECFDFRENIKTIINYRGRELRIYFKHMSWHGETCGNKGGFSHLFSPDSDDRLNLNFHRFVIFISVVIHEVWAFGQYCLPKVSNGLKSSMFWNKPWPNVLYEDQSVLFFNVLTYSFLCPVGEVSRKGITVFAFLPCVFMVVGVRVGVCAHHPCPSNISRRIWRINFKLGL